MPISKIKSISESDFSAFQDELLEVLKRDADHHIDFDGKLVFHSGRYNCELAAMDVHWDKNKGDIVLVGAVRSGGIIDESKGFPQLVPNVEISFRECFEDMRGQKMNEVYLISKTKKSVLNKYIIQPMKQLETVGIAQGGKLLVSDFGLKPIDFGDSKVTGIEKDDNDKIILSSDSHGQNLPVFENSLSMIQKFGESLSRVVDSYKAATKDFVEAKRSLVGNNQTYSDYDILKANSEGMATLFEKGYHAGICNAVTKNFTGSAFFDLSKNDFRSISKAVDDYRRKNILIQKDVQNKEKDLKPFSGLKI